LWGERDISEMVGLLALSGVIEPLTAMEVKENGKRVESKQGCYLAQTTFLFVNRRQGKAGDWTQ